MARLEDLKPGVVVEGILPDQLVTIVSVTSLGPDVVEPLPHQITAVYEHKRKLVPGFTSKYNITQLVY